MKIAIPTLGSTGLDDTVAVHFGRCPYYTILDEQGTIISIIDNSSVHTNGTQSPPELLHQHNITVLLCQDLGPKALQLCKQLNIEVYVNAEPTVRGLFTRWQNKELTQAGDNDICKEHSL